MLSGKKIILGITGGIAAYKSAWLVRAFIKQGAEVRVIMTPDAKDFVTPLTLSTLSKNEVLSSFTNDEENALWNNHVELGLWADFFVIAPATANTLSKMASGASDNLLLATYLSAKCPVYFAPAMDLDMYKHATTQNNFEQLASFGNIMIPATSGELASGLEGQGRMAEPEDIITFIDNDIKAKAPLYGKKVLITAGPTYEAIDPVRFIGNHSSGKMGYALANQAAELGAEVLLISGPTALTIKNPSVKVIHIVSAAELFKEVGSNFESVDIAIAAAAVADYRPSNPATQKIKKKSTDFQILLEPTEDSLKYMGDHKNGQYLVGFALETENELEHAKDKMSRKNLDLIVLNSLNDKGAGFGNPTNKVTLITADGKVIPQELKAKEEVAIDIFNYIRKALNV
ncbi:MAG: bifunctional phosphopantothenoylcysteine decarboxylase/phosphopantothenate--cysteine ligase CoaBC [Leeuwenhoekiella sp.]